MRGSQNCSNDIRYTLLVVLSGLISVWMTSCAGSKQSSPATARGETLADFIARYEKTFRPSDYRLDFAIATAGDSQQFAALHSATVYTPVLPETLQGFRIQVFMTKEIDEANATLTALEEQLPEEFAYMAYDAPYYKIRVGNFTDRSAAAPMLKRLTSLGYRDSWIVPDKVFKNPPPKLPDAFIAPSRSIEHRH